MMIVTTGVSGKTGNLRARRVLLCVRVMVLGIVLLAGCAGKQTPAASPQPPVTQKSAPAAQTQNAQPVAAPIQPAVATSVPPEPEKARPAKASSAEGSAVDRLLRSAGRDPAAAQPEAGFVLQAPDTVGDGEAFLVEFGADGLRQVSILWRGKTLNIDPAKSRRPGVAQALLPVPLDEKSRTLPLSMTATWADGRTERFSADMKVSKRAYPVQKLKVAQKYVTPPADMQAKIKKDRAEMQAALATSVSEQHWSVPMLRPVPGQITSLFGLRRVFNNQPRSPHRGLDLDGKQGDPIGALDNGIVVLVAEQYYGGNTVVVDHGLGVFSLYLHLSSFNVTKGQRISRGDVVGYVGKTGRVTGPHLHLSLSVQGVSVNPVPCLDM